MPQIRDVPKNMFAAPQDCRGDIVMNQPTIVQTQKTNPSSPPFTKGGIPLFEKEGLGGIWQPLARASGLRLSPE
jgi:hypothetical protein